MKRYVLICLFVISVGIISLAEVEKTQGFTDLTTSQQTSRENTGQRIVTIVYMLSVLFNELDRQAIRSAMDLMENFTCIRWRERDRRHFVDYVTIAEDKWYWSHLMKTGIAGNMTSEFGETPQHWTEGEILHALMHTLGLKHEHQRSDRNSYVTVNWDNIIDGDENKFVKSQPLLEDSLDVDYDYRSVMHYTSHMLAKNSSKPVLTAKSCNLNLEDIGEGLSNGHLTYLDIQKINKLFGCS